MTRTLCCFVLTCIVSSCAPKATEVVETPVTPPKRNKPVTAPEAPTEPLRVVNLDGMQLPDLTQKLPDRNDMTPTTAATTGGGVIATPPSPRPPVNE